MYLIEVIARLLCLLGKTIYTVFQEVMKTFSMMKSYLIAIWIVATFVANLLWIVERSWKARRNMVLPMMIFSTVNIVFAVTWILELFLLGFQALHPRGDAMCKTIKWSDTTCVMILCGLIIYILFLFRHPQTLEKKINKNMLQMLIIAPIITVTQVSFQMINFYYYLCLHY